MSIWITHPTIYPQIKGTIKKNNRIVYDCMDDMVAFPEVKNDPEKVKFILKSEKALLEKSSVVFCSSDMRSHISSRFDASVMFWACMLFA